MIANTITYSAIIVCLVATFAAIQEWHKIRLTIRNSQ